MNNQRIVVSLNLKRTIKIMKLTVLMLAVCLSSVVASTYAQTATLNVSAKNETLEKVLKQIEKQSEFLFFYNLEEINKNEKISINEKNANIQTVLDAIAAKTGLKYTIKDRHIVLTSEAAPASTATTQQNRKVTGTVSDAFGPVAGANVIQKGTTNGTTTDMDGNFSIEVPANATLQISFIGYIPQDIVVKNQNVINVLLKEDTQALEEVIVVGYGTMKKKDMTGAVASVKMDDTPVATVSTVSHALAGKAAGLQVSTISAQPGGQSTFRIRGAASSDKAGNDPLIIIDGFPVNSPGSLDSGNQYSGGNKDNILASINPNDIESIEILKDASAAIYGIGAADGVILVTTKKGKEGKPTIVYEGSYSIQKHYPYLEVLSGPELMNMVNVFSKENYLYDKGQYPYGNTAYDDKWTPIFTPTQIANAPTTDWLDKVLKTGAVTNHNLTISGGSEKFKYYLGVNYYKEDATVHNSDMERYSLRTNITSQLTNFLKLTTIVNLNQNNYTNSTVGGDVGNLGDQGAGALFGAIFYPSYLPIYDAEGKYNVFSRTPNPVSMHDINDKSEQSGYYMNFSLDVDIIKNMLSAKVLYGLNKENTSRDSYIPSDVYYALQRKSRGNLGYGKRQQSTLEGTLTFQHKFGELLDMNLMAGMGRYLDSGDGSDISYENANDHIQGSSVGMADGPFYPTSYKYKNEKRSQFVRGNFDLLGRYVVSASLRRDGTDKFFPSKKYALFPSVSLAWKMNEESFIKNISWINMLKLRASYGETGSDNLGTTLYGIVTTTREDVQFNNNSVTYIPYILSGANYEDVTWQKTVMKNIGLDFSVLRDRIWGSVDVFRNDVTHLLGTAPTELLGMHGTRPINGGHYKRTGVDVSLNSLNLQTHDFKWTSQITMSHYNAYAQL